MIHALVLEGGPAFVQFQDHGVSEDARTIRAGMVTALDPGPRVVVVSRIERAITLLQEAVAEAKSSGWDGDRAKPLDRDAFQYGAQLLLALALEKPLPEVAVDVDGEIALEWDRGPRRLLSVRVGRDGRVSYAGLVGSATFYGTEVLREGIPIAISAGIDRVLSGH